MRTSIGILPIAAALLMACSGESLKEDRGVVEQLTDSTIKANIGGDTYTLSTKNVQLATSALMVGDSVKIGYIGDLASGEGRALILELIDKPSQVVEAGYDETKELLTSDHDEQPSVSDNEDDPDADQAPPQQQ